MLEYSIFGISILEWIGYLASSIVLVSLIMSSIVKLRIINSIGAFIFCVYGLLIGSYPVAMMNGLIIFFNTYHLYKMYNMREEFSIMEASPNSSFLGRFIEMSSKDIRKYFPKFRYKNQVNNISFYILRDTTVAGLFLATHYDTDTLRVVLDYVIPEYRDLKVGKYIHHQLNRYFISKGYRKLLCETAIPAHIKYLNAMGYERTTVNNKTVYIKTFG